MPIVLLAILRVTRALVSTLMLLTDRKVLRALPWGYLKGLPRRDRGIALLCISVALTLLATIVVLAAPVRTVRADAWALGSIAGGLGIVGSWVRGGVRRRR